MRPFWHPASLGERGLVSTTEIEGPGIDTSGQIGVDDPQAVFEFG